MMLMMLKMTREEQINEQINQLITVSYEHTARESVIEHHTFITTTKHHHFYNYCHYASPLSSLSRPREQKQKHKQYIHIKLQIKKERTIKQKTNNSHKR